MNTGQKCAKADQTAPQGSASSVNRTSLAQPPAD